MTSGILDRLAQRPSSAQVVAYLGVAVLLTVVGFVLPALSIWPERSFRGVERTLLEGRVVAVLTRQVIATPTGDVASERLAIDVDGLRIEADRLYALGTADDFTAEPGDRLQVYRTETSAGTSYQVRGRARPAEVWIIGAVFAVLTIAVGRWQGLWSLLALGASLLVVARFIVPAILGGADPLLVCITGAMVIITATLTLGHGANRKSVIALAATCVCLVLAGLLATWAVDLTLLTGLVDDDAATLRRFSNGAIDMRGLLLGGIILGAVGVLDDVTTTQASTVLELRDVDPQLSRRELFTRAMRVGRDHIAATTNTLLLAYAGAALPTLVLLAGFSEPLSRIVSFESLTTEIVRTAAGSIAIVAAVPVATALAVLVAGRAEDARTPEPSMPDPAGQ